VAKKQAERSPDRINRAKVALERNSNHSYDGQTERTYHKVGRQAERKNNVNKDQEIKKKGEDGARKSQPNKGLKKNKGRGR
jgi:hypothetical protein